MLHLFTRTSVSATLLSLGLASASASAQTRQALDIDLPSAVTDEDFYNDGRYPQAQVELGQLLFFDKILSGNQNIACATCHHPKHATSDGVALPLGEGAVGLGPERRTGPGAQAVSDRVPRNAQALFFIGAKARDKMFHDGRVEKDPAGNWHSGFWTPAREQLPQGLDNVLAAQALFPVLSAVEMAGQKGENPVATATALRRFAGKDGAWELLVDRLRQIPEYVARFQRAYPDQVERASDLNIVQVGNAIAAFETTAFRAEQSPFDEVLRQRDPSLLNPAAERGLALFYGKASCADCHRGKFLTDVGFHVLATPQIGPGKGDGFAHEYTKQTGLVGRFEDYGRYRVSGKATDRYAFKTPSLRNVELTGPWGHAGAFQSLEAVVRHHVDPRQSLQSFRPALAPLPELANVVELTATGSRLGVTPLSPTNLSRFGLRDYWVMQQPELVNSLLGAATEKLPPLTDNEILDLVEFLRALTDPSSRHLEHLVPKTVPSGLEIDR